MNYIYSQKQHSSVFNPEETFGLVSVGHEVK